MELCTLEIQKPGQVDPSVTYKPTLPVLKETLTWIGGAFWDVITTDILGTCWFV